MGSAINSTTVMMWWDPLPVEARNGIVIQYSVSLLERETGSMKHGTSTELSINVGSLHPDYTYDCRVAAVTVEEGPFSAVVSIHTPIAGKWYSIAE